MGCIKKGILPICILLFTLLASCSKPVEETTTGKPVIRVAYLPITHSIPILVQNELEKDMDSPYTLELVKFASWSELVDALSQNRVDGASILFEVALRLNKTSPDLKIVSLSHRDGNVLITGDGIDSFEDLKDKAIAIPHRLSPHNTLLHILLEEKGMAINDVKIIELAPAEMPSSLVTGAISGFIVAEPYGSISDSGGVGKILFNSDDFYDHSICCSMVFHNSFLLNDIEVTQAFLDNFEKASEIADKKDDFVVETYRNHINLRESVIKSSLTNISYANLNMLEDEYIDISNLILKYGILDSVPPYNQLIYERP